MCYISDEASPDEVEGLSAGVKRKLGTDTKDAEDQGKGKAKAADDLARSKAQAPQAHEQDVKVADQKGKQPEKMDVDATSNKRAREDDGNAGEPPAKKVDAKADAA